MDSDPAFKQFSSDFARILVFYRKRHIICSMGHVCRLETFYNLHFAEFVELIAMNLLLMFCVIVYCGLPFVFWCSFNAMNSLVQTCEKCVCYLLRGVYRPICRAEVHFTFSDSILVSGPYRKILDVPMVIVK